MEVALGNVLNKLTVLTSEAALWRIGAPEVLVLGHLLRNQVPDVHWLGSASRA